MVDWDADDFMSQWNSKYVATNVKIGSRPYSEQFFLSLNTKLSHHTELQNYAYAIIVCGTCWIPVDENRDEQLTFKGSSMLRSWSGGRRRAIL